MLDGITNIKASETLKELKMYSEDLQYHSADEVAEAIDMAIKALEKQSVIDKIRAEIEAEPYISKMEVLDIIDKYKAESEDREQLQ